MPHCDKCEQQVDMIHHTRGVPDGEYWCIGCCDRFGVDLGKMRSWRPAYGVVNEIRERWEAEQKAKKRAKLQAFLESRGKAPKAVVA